MNRKTFIRIVALVLAVVLVGSVLVSVISAGAAHAVTQGEIDALEAEQEEIREKMDALQAEIDSVENQQNTLLAQKSLLDERIALTRDEIANSTKMIREYEQMIADKTIEVAQCAEKESQQWEKYKNYIRIMEENGRISYFEILFSATSFADFLDRIDMIAEIMSYEDQMYKDLGEAKEATIAAKADLRVAKTAKEAQKEELEAYQADLETQQEQAAVMIEELEASLDTYNQLYDEMSAQEQAVYDEILEKEAALEELRRAAEESGRNSGYVVGTGSFIWPTVENYVTSPYGYRIHPIYGDWRFHTGIDISGDYGYSIYAADGGTVITADYSYAYGNYIVISHGNGTTTLYGHMTTLYVSEGESVYQGEVIGAMGSTGNSTGPHLHFEITVNGSRVDPLNYFSNYVPYWD